MAHTGRLDFHQPDDDASICLYDHEDWPCTVQQVRTQVADEIDRTVREDLAYRPKWVNGMTEAAAIARGDNRNA